MLEPLIVAPEAPTFNPVSGSEVRKDDIITISCTTEGAKLNLYDAELNPIVTDASFPYSYTVSMESGTLELMAEAVGSTGLKTDAVATYTVTNDSRVFIDLQQQSWKDPSDNNNTKSPYNKDNGFAADFQVTSGSDNVSFTKFATIAKVTLPKTGNYPAYYEETKGDATTGALRMYPANGNMITLMAPAGYAFTRANVVYTKANVIKINGQEAASGAYVNFTDQPTFINFDVTGVTIDETGNNKSVRLTGINLGLVWVGKLGKPNFNPPTEGPWDAGTEVSIACGDPNADIEYVIEAPDGTSKTCKNKQDMAKFTLDQVGTWTITAQAMGYKIDDDHIFQDSDIHEKTYQVVACQAPEFSPANGSEVGYGSKITMKTSSTGCKIWRKVEGVDTDWVQAASYTVKATEAGTLKIQAKAVNEYGESTISEATYTVVARPIVAPKLTFTVAEGNFKPDAAFDVEIKLNDDCFPVPETIYYTLNGTRAHVAPAHEEAFEHRSVYTLGTKIPVSAEQAKALTGGAHSQALTINAYCDNGLEPDDPNYASDTASATYTFAPTTYTQGTEVTYDQWTRITKDSTLGDGLGLLMVSTEHSQAMSTTQKNLHAGPRLLHSPKTKPICSPILQMTS